MSGVGSAVFVFSVISITVVSNDYCFVTYFVSSSYNVLYASVNSYDSLFDGFVNTCVAYHVTISEVYYDKVILILLNSSDEFVLHFVS